MKKKSYGVVLISMLLVWAVVGWMTFNSNQESQPAVEYWAVCRNLPANAHWNGLGEKDDGTRKEIPQTESSPNVRTPSPVGIFSEVGSDAECHFVCNNGYGWNGTLCDDGRAACEREEITIWSYTIAACNVGASVAGTGEASYGNLFQRGNNFGFASTGTINAASGQVDASDYGPSKPYTSGTYLLMYQSRDSSQNGHLRGGSGDTQINDWDSGNARTERQWPCATGYHVPSKGEWVGMVSAAGGTGSDFLFTILPLVGYRPNNSSTIVGAQGLYGNYWASTPVSDNGSAYCFALGDSNVNVDTCNTYRSNGFSLRCFKDS